jgi:hypothetical protein
LEKTREEVRSLRQQVAAPALAQVQAEGFVPGRVIRAQDWHNVGAATARAALETVLWAGAGGDIAALSQMLQFVDAKARKSAQALLENVPQSLREQYPSPEKLIAFLAVKDVPLGSVKLLQSSDLSDWPSPASNLKLLMVNADGTRKNTNLVFMKSDEVWKLIVTEGVVAKYSAALQAPAGQDKKN